MRIAPPIALTTLLVLSCGLVVVFSGSALAQTTERADKRFSGETEETKQHGSVTLTIEAGNKYGTAFAAGMQGYRVPVVYRRDILLTEIIAEPIPGKEKLFVKMLVEGMGLPPAVADKTTVLIYKHAHVDEYYTNDQMVPSEAETCEVRGAGGMVLIGGFVAGAGYLKGGSVGVEVTKWRNEGGVAGLFSDIEVAARNAEREKIEAKERAKREKKEAEENAKRDREEAKRKTQEEKEAAKRKAQEEKDARKRAEKESKQ
jgi:hypothetical protein